MNPQLIQELKCYINDLNYARLFEQIQESFGTIHSLSALRDEYIFGSIKHDYNNRLQTFVTTVFVSQNTLIDL